MAPALINIRCMSEGMYPDRMPRHGPCAEGKASLLAVEVFRRPQMKVGPSCLMFLSHSEKSRSCMCNTSAFLESAGQLLTVCVTG